MPSTIVSGREVFRHEIADAKRLGFRLMTLVENGVALARLVPDTPQATAALEQASPGSSGLEGKVEYVDERESLGALRDAMHAALELARGVTA